FAELGGEVLALCVQSNHLILAASRLMRAVPRLICATP
uniref:Uncharacterized protein n=1 Tax=Ciona intestinalis TaxID=7719 RepID=H2XU24_CIOIN